MKQHSIVVRKWQKDAGSETTPFKQGAFDNDLRKPVELMLRTSSTDLHRLIVVVNGDRRFPKVLGEVVGDDGLTPTMRALQAAFGEDIDILLDPNWGNNAGSTSALNLGWQHAAKNPGVDHIFSWNPEMALTGHHLARIRQFMYEHFLEACGYLRAGHWERPQFNLFQNTSTMYLLDSIQEVDGFHSRCDGNDGATIMTKEFGEVTLAGMDDQEFLLRLVLSRGGDIPRIGMVGRSDPAPWQTRFDDRVRQQEFDIKVARQMAVLRTWVELHLPEVTFEDYLGRLFRQMFIGS